MRSSIINCFTVTLALSSAVTVSAMEIVTSRKWPNEYIELNGYLYHDQRMNYQKAVEYCKLHSGKLLAPKDEDSWNERLQLMRDKQETSSDQEESNWIGVTMQKIGKSKLIARDSVGELLTDRQVEMIFRSGSSTIEKMQESEVYCVTFSPPSSTHNNWYFQPQACNRRGVEPVARPVCQWVSDPNPEKTDPINPQVGLPTALSHSGSVDVSGTESNSTKKKDIQPRLGQGEIDEDGSDVEVKDTENSSSTSIVVIVGMLVACCMVASAYYVTKKRGWNVREMISRRMPYNRPRVTVEVDTYSRGQELTDLTSNHRPIHVYEEIIPRNFGTGGARHEQRNHVLSSSSTTTIPQDPPPEPPTTTTSLQSTPISLSGISRSVEDGYLKPSFRRGDAIPGDVRSPPPVTTNAFDFSGNREDSSQSRLQIPVEKELKYASVETVHTLMGEKEVDEEYFIEDHDEEENGSLDMNPLVVDMPSKTQESDTTTNNNQYVPTDGDADHFAIESDVGNDVIFSPVFALDRSEYENERFIETLVKKKPTKPCRTNMKRTQDGAVRLVQQPASVGESVVYSRIPSISKEPIYSQVKKKNEKKSESSRESTCGGYAVMKSDIQIRSCNLPDGHDHISVPCMVSTTNKVLEDSSAAFYEIPPESCEFETQEA